MPKQSKKDIAALDKEFETHKTQLEAELDDYALGYKQKIKAAILAENDKLASVKDELKTVDEDLEAKRTELRELNQVYIDEQLAIKDSKAETDRIIEENKQKVAESKQELKNLQLEINRFQFEKDNVMITIAKAKAEHDKFVDYEKKAKKLLNEQARELNNREADLGSDKGFLKTQRSVLSEM